VETLLGDEALCWSNNHSVGCGRDDVACVRILPPVSTFYRPDGACGEDPTWSPTYKGGLASAWIDVDSAEWGAGGTNMRIRMNELFGSKHQSVMVCHAGNSCHEIRGVGLGAACE
jgi:hypothetical protein